jgi:hypothetical protein
MPPEERKPLSHLDRICAIAARLNEDAAVLRSLGLHEAAHLLAAAAAHLDDRIYANGFHHDDDSGLLPPSPRRGRRTKAKPVSH